MPGKARLQAGERTLTRNSEAGNNRPRAELRQDMKMNTKRLFARRWAWTCALMALVSLGVVPPREQAAAARPHALARKNPILPGLRANGAALLPNGWSITPAGHLLALPGDLPLQMQITPNGKFLLVNTGGFHDHTVSIVNIATQTITQSIDVGKNWDGLAVSASGDAVFVSGGGAPTPAFLQGARQRGASSALLAGLAKPILRLGLAQGKLAAPVGMDVAGLDESTRFVAGLAAARNGALFVLDAQTNSLYKLGGRPLATVGFVATGYGPSRVALSPDQTVAAVTNEGEQSVSLFNTDTLDKIGTIPVGIHPHALVYGKDGRLFVANSGSSTVSVISGGAVRETISTALDPGLPVGSTPDALALAPDESRLYVANAGNNSVAVLDTSDPAETKVLGFIPTAWYPTALAVSPSGAALFVGTAKGALSRANVPAITRDPRTDYNNGQKYDYIGNILTGHVAVVPVPGTAALAAYTRQVTANTPAPAAVLTNHNARIADSAFAAFRHITHVLYIIRENRTYDQVLGDMAGGNGDPSLCLFGAKVTPNAHALAKRTVLLDNLYCNGEVSEDGHQWCDSAYATDTNERSWPSKYGGRGEPDADERLTASPAGYLWDECAGHALTYYSYGETSQYKASPDAPPSPAGDPGHGTLAGHLSPAWAAIPFGRHDTERAAIFLADLKQAEQTGQWPRFQIMSLGEDHTEGLKAGAYSPVAHVAANDLALGQIVQGVSQSRFWRSTAIFVIEDDAQNGPDHVDAHRTVGLVISPYARHGMVDSTFYTTASFVRTMQLILRMPPLTQYDHAAAPLYAAFTDKPDFAPLLLAPPQVDLETRNPAGVPGAAASARLDLSAPDRADPNALNAVLWHALRPGQSIPAPVRSAHGL